jgi:hypothetical protein
MIIEYNGIKYKMEYDKSLNMTLLYNSSDNNINKITLQENQICYSENNVVDNYPDNVVGYWCKVLNTIVLL